MLLRTSLTATLFLATILPSQKPRVDPPAAPGGAATEHSAQQEVEGLIEAARAGNATAFWQWLPNSYQDDVEGLLHDLAIRVDAEVYARSMRLARRIAEIGVDKQSFFFANPMVARSLAQSHKKLRPTADTYRTVLRLLGELASSDLRTVEGLRNFDGTAFMRRSGKSMLQGLFAVARSQGNDPMAELEHSTVKTLRQNGDRARLELGSAGKPTEIEDYVLVEGHWLPVKLVRDWTGAMQKARGKVAALPVGGDKRTMAQARFMLGVIEGLLRKFEDAETQEEFDAAMEGVMALAQRGAQKRSR